MNKPINIKVTEIDHREDITEYSEHELSLKVLHDEKLYAIRHDNCLFDVLKDRFIYTKEQLKVLKYDIKSRKGSYS